VKGTFKDYIQGNIDHGESVIKVIDDLDQMERSNILTVSADGKFLSPMVITCFDTIMFNGFKPDSTIEINIPLNNYLNCLSDSIHLYTSVKKGTYFEWAESSAGYTIKQINGSKYITIKTDSFKGCMNFAYPVDTPCFAPVKAILKLKNITLSQLYGFITNINITYIPVKKDNNTYEIFRNESETTNLIFNMVAKDNKNKIYNLRNFPLSMCRYNEKENTYILTKKDLIRFLKPRRI
ncbi:MAG TPA: hypothetical protein VJY62_03635, partial [Bacteroidia bacterium]|nr:hypothetical protein [Bacteroidia bacterium]